jgi:hypothetical protein
MANVIRIKRTTTSSRPDSLANAELAFIEGSQKLVYGTGTGGAGGSATSIIDIGGVGAFLGLSNSLTQTAAGTYTFSGTVSFSGSPTAATPDSSDSSTKVATTAYVKAQGYLTSETYLGTVTSVAISLPGIFSVSGSPITSSGTLSASLVSQTANYVWAGPTTGSSAAPTFRALVAGDIPTLTASKISDFATTAQGYRLDQFAVPTADVSLNSQKITNLADPVSAQDAATKAYVDAARSGLDVKASVRAATTANITLSGTQTIDGVSLNVGDRVLVKNQSASSQNGIYVVAAGSWARATDADSDAEVTPGMFAFIEEGTANGDSGWVLSTNSPTTLGTTALTFAQFSGTGQITAGDGLTKTSNTLDIVTASSSRIVVNADSIDLASNVISATGTYQSVTVDTYGRVTAGTNPATLSGYGITDAQSQISATGILKGAGSGSVSAATAGTDYQAAISATGVLKGTGGGSVSAATAGTDYQAAITATGLLKGAGSGSVSAAVAGTDYLSPSSDIDGGSYP